MNANAVYYRFLIGSFLAVASYHNNSVAAYNAPNPWSFGRSSSHIKASLQSPSSPPEERPGNIPSETTTTETDAFLEPAALILPFSIFMAVCMVAWEDYGAANLWPSRRMMTVIERSNNNNNIHPSNYDDSVAFGAKSIGGLAFGKRERLKLLQEEPDQLPSSLLPEIRAYNEVMEEHRTERVSRWQATTDPTQIGAAVKDLQQILRDILHLQELVKEYEWESVHSIIQTSIVPKLEPAATVLRRQLSDNTLSQDANSYNVGYEQIGFDWGSCAWRHCGALADAQEALDELDHLLGILEPPECLFCLNIAERSIRDMLAVVPASYEALKGVPEYIPYQPVNTVDENGEETDLLDQEYLQMLNELRNGDLTSDEE